jgi:hypothetical protein
MSTCKWDPSPTLFFLFFLSPIAIQIKTIKISTFYIKRRLGTYDETTNYKCKIISSPGLGQYGCFRIISIPSKFGYFRLPDHVISMELLALNFRCQCTQQKLQSIYVPF